MKKLKKKLKNKFTKTSGDYSLIGGVKDWLIQCGLKPSDKNIQKICKLNGGVVPYPYQKKDRKRIIKNANKY